MNARDNKNRKRKAIGTSLPQTARHKGARLQGLPRARSESTWHEGVGGDQQEPGGALSTPPLPAEPYIPLIQPRESSSDQETAPPVHTQLLSGTGSLHILEAKAQSKQAS